jgi:predicted LPLAT superfamily acyltransferase
MVVTLPSPNDRAASAPRNPGPSWGFQFLRICDRVLPEIVYCPIRALGTAIAMVGMPAQRQHSRAYLATVLDRPPTWRDVFRHFFAFEEALMLKLRVANGRSVPCDYAPSGQAFRDWVAIGGPVLLGTMHVGVSDMLGFQLGGQVNPARTPQPSDLGETPMPRWPAVAGGTGVPPVGLECKVSAGVKRRVYLVRQRVGNSHDTERLAARFGDWLRFVWVNDPGEMLFALKTAAATGDAIALQCDRVEFSTRTAAFDFLGARRLFPVTIYHLARIFDRPVILTVGLTTPAGRSRLYGSPRFDPVPGESRGAAATRAHGHFQDFLRQVEGLLREQPYVWFNFTPLNPLAPAGAPLREPPSIKFRGI